MIVRHIHKNCTDKAKIDIHFIVKVSYVTDCSIPDFYLIFY
jgi:hypothetical protein